MPAVLSKIIATAIAENASDIHLAVGSLPRLRILGELVPMQELPVLDASRIATFRMAHLQPAVSTATPSTTSRSTPPNDFSYIDPSTSRRFRVNTYSTVRGDQIAMRLIPEHVPSLIDLSTPDILTTLALLHRGLVIVTGPTGSGKSATLAAMVNHINDHRNSHIITLEDPIEYLHENKRCLLSQREIHAHARGYTQALKDAVREDPDVILVGEMRDPETIRMCLTAAETGHLVLSTLHTRSAPQAVDRIVDVFPAGEKEAVRTMLAESLQGVVAQQLVRHRTEPRRLAVFETMLCTPGIRNCIRESQTGQIRGIIGTNLADGMMTFDQALASKVANGQITAAVAREVAHNPALFA